MIALDILLDGLFAAVAAVGFGAISDPPMRAFPRIALLAAADGADDPTAAGGPVGAQADGGRPAVRRDAGRWVQDRIQAAGGVVRLLVQRQRAHVVQGLCADGGAQRPCPA